MKKRWIWYFGVILRNLDENWRKIHFSTPITRKNTIKRNLKDAVFDNQLHERSKFCDIWWYLENFDVNKPKYTEKLYTILVWNITEWKSIHLWKVIWREEWIKRNNQNILITGSSCHLKITVTISGKRFVVEVSDKYSKRNLLLAI